VAFLLLEHSDNGACAEEKLVFVGGHRWLLVSWHTLAERIDHEGCILGPASTVTNALLFNTPQADAVVSAM